MADFYTRLLQKDLLQPLLLGRTKKYLELVLPYLKGPKDIVDIGCGMGHTAVLLQQKGYKVTGLDIVNSSFTKEFTPILYDGQKMPFADKQFDVALLLMMLHHTPNPDKIINEAARVSRELVIIEDIYSNRLHKYATYFFDSLLNMEFRGHPHTNKTDNEWQKLFARQGMKVISVKYKWSYIVFRHAVYHLESN